MDHQRKASIISDTGEGARKDEEGDRKKKELDEAMEEMFKRNTDKFSISDLQSDQQPPKTDPGGLPKYDEGDYQGHRMGGYFPTHQPLQRRNSKKRDDSEEPDGLEVQSDDGVTVADTGGGRSKQVPDVEFMAGSASSLDAASRNKNDPYISGSRQSLTSSERPLRPSLKKPSLTFTPKMGEKQVSFPEKKGPSLLMSTSDADVVSRYSDKNSASEPLMSERAGTHVPDTTIFGADSRVKVKFQLGGADSSADVKEDKDELNQKHLAHKDRYDHYHRHHHHHRRHSSKRLQRQGSDQESETVLPQVVEPEEAELLPTADLDDIASRRFEDPRGIRRHKIQSKSSVSSFIHPNRKGSEDTRVLPVKKLFDHQPHEVFVELDELCPDEGGDELEWRETARWIKYEQNVQEGADRWGKPHVASLSFHSLLSLRKCIEQGTVMLDMEEKDLAGIAYRVVENMVITDQLLPEHRGAVMRALLLRHRHINDRSLASFGLRRNNSGYGSMNLLSHDRIKSPKLIPANGSYPGGEGMEKGLYKLNGDGSILPDIKVTLDNSSRRPSQDLERIFRNTSTDDLPQMDTSILRRIPEGAEATTVLVGALDFLDQPIIAFVRLAEGLIMQNLMEVSIPVRFIFILLGPIGSDLDYHEVGRSISTLMANSTFHDVAYRAEDRKDLLCAINEFLDDSIVLPPDNCERKSLLPLHDIRRKSIELRNRKKRDQIHEKFLDHLDGKPPSDPLQRTGRLFGGVINDVKRRYPFYLSDFLDGLNAQSLAATIFIFFAALAGAITFGGLMGDKTGNLVGVSETLICTSACGVIFALFSGQPLIIIGATGPLLLYDEILFKFCQDNEIEYLPMRVWIGLWFGLITTVFVAFEGSALVRFFTRFTQEIFAALISLLYIFECLNKLVNVFLNHPLLPDYCNVTAAEIIMNDTVLNDPWNNTAMNDSLFNSVETNYTTVVIGDRMEAIQVVRLPINQPNTALLSAILTIGTFFIAYFLRQFRNSKFLGRSARRALGDFGVPISMILMVALGYIAKDTYTQKLSVPEGLTPSDPKVRGWVISPLGLEKPIAVWHVFAASVAAILLYILVFLEVQICELILNKKDRKLKKGSGFHLDLLLLGYIQIGVGLMGGPFMCAATVRSVSHLASVTVMSRTHAPGEMPHVIEVKEQRLSSLLVSLLIGVSVLMAPLLQQVPVACLFGVFLYMGVSSMNGIQLFDRIQYLFMPVKHHPDLVYVSKVRTWKMHMYTLIQVSCLGVLWVVKSTEAALAFPFVLLMMVPLRLQLKCCFTPKELEALDGEHVEEDLKDEPDFYEQIVP